MDYAITAREEDDLWSALERNFGVEARMAMYTIDEIAWVQVRRWALSGQRFTEFPGAQPAPR